MIFQKNTDFSNDTRQAEYTKALESFQHEHGRIVSRCVLLNIFDDNLGPKVARLMDDIEDAVAHHCGIKSLGASINAERKFTKVSDLEHAINEICLAIANTIISSQLQKTA